MSEKDPGKVHDGYDRVENPRRDFNLGVVQQGERWSRSSEDRPTYRRFGSTPTLTKGQVSTYQEMQMIHTEQGHKPLRKRPMYERSTLAKDGRSHLSRKVHDENDG